MNNITEDFITFETAKLAKSKGFNINCQDCFIYNPEKFNTPTEPGDGTLTTKVEYLEKYGDNCVSYLRPTQALLAKWLREIHKIHIEISIGHDERQVWYDAYLYNIKLGYCYEPIATEDVGGMSFEDAYENALRNALNLI